MHDTALLAEPDIGPLFAAHEGDSDPDMDEALRRARGEVAEYFAAVTPAGAMTEGARFTTAVMATGSVGRVRPLLRHLMGGEGDLPPSPIHIPPYPRQPERPDNRTLAAVAA